MKSVYKRILELQTLSGSASQEVWDSWDIGNYKELSLLFRVVSAGSGGTLTIEHAAVNREEAFTTLTSVSLTAAGDTFEVKEFLRFVRWSYDSAAGNPMAMIEGVAKQ